MINTDVAVPWDQTWIRQVGPRGRAVAVRLGHAGEINDGSSRMVHLDGS